MSQPAVPQPADADLLRLVPRDPSARRRVLLTLLRTIVNLEEKGK
jgi:hypothetical protein